MPHSLRKTLGREALIGKVTHEHRALRTPIGPFRPAVFESLGDFADVAATIDMVGVEIGKVAAAVAGNAVELPRLRP